MQIPEGRYQKAPQNLLHIIILHTFALMGVAVFAVHPVNMQICNVQNSCCMTVFLSSFCKVSAMICVLPLWRGLPFKIVIFIRNPSSYNY